MTKLRQSPHGQGIHFRLSEPGHLILLKTYVNNAGPFAFILDTGASMTVISPLTARAAGIGHEGQKAKALGAGGGLDATVVRVVSMRVGPILPTKISVAIMCLREISRSINVKLGGIVGYNFLRRYCLTIDYSKRRLWLQVSSTRAMPS